MGDFNTILGAYEHQCRYLSMWPPMQDFHQNWTDNFELLHLPIRGAHFTWNNGRKENIHA